MAEVMHTPGPWKAAMRHHPGTSDTVCIKDAHSRDIVSWMGFDGVPCTKKEIRANARLIAAAPDHASVGWAMCVAAARWEPWGDGRGEFCMNGLCYATKLDEFGLPEVNDAIRAAIAKARSQPSKEGVA